MLGLLTAEILLKEIDLIVLFHGLLGATGEILGSLSETESGISVKLLLILGNITGLSIVELLWPTYFLMKEFKLFLIPKIATSKMLISCVSCKCLLKKRK